MNYVDYAEKTLGVHQPWEDFQTQRATHADATNNLSELRPTIRSLKIQIEDRKLEIANETGDRWQELSATARKEALKLFTENDKQLQDLEADLFDAQASLDQNELVLKHAEVVIHALTARMNELGGLLTFFAVNKSLGQPVSLKPIFDFTAMAAQLERLANPLMVVEPHVDTTDNTDTSAEGQKTQ